MATFPAPMNNEQKIKYLQDRLANQLAEAQITSETLNEVIEQRKMPKEPGWEFDKYSIEVQFKRGGKCYEYLLLRMPNGAYFTTGKAPSDYFATWDIFMKWLKDNAHWHGPMYALDVVRGGNAMALDANEVNRK